MNTKMDNKKQPKLTMYCIMVMLFWIAMYTYQPQLSIYSEMLGAGAAMTGTILSSYGFTQMLCRIPLGILSDRIRKRKLFVILGSVITVLSAFGMYLAKDPMTLLIFRGLSGLSASAWVTYTVLFSSYFDAKDAPKAMSRIMVFNSSGTLIAMLVGGWFAEYFGIRSSFLLACVSGIAATILGFQVVENVPEDIKPMKIRDLLSVLTNRTLLSVSILGLCYQTVQQAATIGFTPKFAAEMGASASQLGILSGAALLGMMISSNANSRFFLKRFEPKQCIPVGLFVYSLATVLLPIVSKDVNTVLLMQVIVGLGSGICFPLMMGLAIAEIDGSLRGVAMGAFQSIYALGMFVGPLITGFLIERYSIGVSISCIGCVGFLALILSLIIFRKKK